MYVHIHIYILYICKYIGGSDLDMCLYDMVKGKVEELSGEELVLHPVCICIRMYLYIHKYVYVYIYM
jgi:hypothetical protein